MRAELETPSRVSSPALSPPYLRPARFDDYERIMRLGVTHAFQIPSPEEWRRLWLENPLWPRLGKDWPIGWVLETAGGEIVGSVGNVPLLYTFRGDHLVAATGRAWSVIAAYRGFALWLLDEHLNQSGVDLFMETSIGPMAVQPFSELCARIPLGDWETVAYWVTGYRAFANKALQKMRAPFPGLLAGPAAAALRLKDDIFSRRLPNALASHAIETADRFDLRFDGFWDELVRHNAETLLADRSSAALSWHFAVPLRKGRLWILTASQNRRVRAYCIVQRQVNGSGVRRMRLVDYQSIEPDVDLLPAFLHVVLERCAAEDICIFEHLGRGLSATRAFDEFAPYRRKLTNWQFFYRTADPDLDAALRTPSSWAPSVFDGDAALE